MILNSLVYHSDSLVQKIVWYGSDNDNNNHEEYLKEHKCKTYQQQK